MGIIYVFIWVWSLLWFCHEYGVYSVKIGIKANGAAAASCVKLRLFVIMHLTYHTKRTTYPKLFPFHCKQQTGGKPQKISLQRKIAFLIRVAKFQPQNGKMNIRGLEFGC